MGGTVRQGGIQINKSRKNNTKYSTMIRVNQKGRKDTKMGNNTNTRERNIIQIN